MPITGAFLIPHPPLILPEIGRGEQLKIQSTINACQEAARRIAVMQPETVVIISPHSIMYKDYFHISPGFRAAGDFARFGYPKVRIKAEYDAALTMEIEKQAQENGILAGTEGEREPDLDHGTMIPLRFIQEAYSKSFKIVRIGLSGLPLSEHFKLGQCIRQAADTLEKRIVIIASGDLSHRLMDSGPYDYVEEGPEYDRRITTVLKEGKLSQVLDFSEDFCARAGECGHRSIAIMAGCMEAVPLKSELLSYEGPFGVGYAVAAFQDAYVALARESLAYYLKNDGVMPMPQGLPEELLDRRAGAFVSLKEFGSLRGCIGTIQAVQKCVGAEIIENAVSAGVWDPRFRPVEEAELDDIICTVDILSDSEPITSLAELDVKKYGVIVSDATHRGLLLPNLEGVDSAEEQVEIALKKAGIEADVTETGRFRMERFEVVRHY